MDLAKSLREAQRLGGELGLSREETAFYDALAENESAREAMESDTLSLMARELTEMIKKCPSLTGPNASRYAQPCDATSADCSQGMATRRN